MKFLLIAAAYLCSTTAAYGVTKPTLRKTTTLQAKADDSSSTSTTHSRRDLLGRVFGSTAAAAIMTANNINPAMAEDAPAAAAVEDVYFGVGCFWHIQHEFIQAERDFLGRNDKELTSLAGYAGGTKTDGNGRVCYHNFQGIADYGKLGHGEVVGMTIPPSNIEDFAKFYFTLYSPKTGERVDPGDKGGEYRSLIGLPGGTNHPEYGKVEAAATAVGKKLVAGKGNDPDTYKTGNVYVYDSKKFPFYPGEVYHQYHDDFQSPPYGKAYNNLANLAFEEGRMKTTGCPDRV
mmetsp:Transcript_15662/g.21762  ORF Transcript_15662/g.21762 Transcript_15662/m.21762 type:complete len:290 (+) Transcript_15662:185-1054(+)